MATITKRGDLQWKVKVMRRGFPSQSRTFETKAQAEAWERMVEGEMDRGVFVDRSEYEKTTFLEALDRYEREVAVLKIVVFDPATLRDMNLSGSAHGIVAVYADGESMLPTIPPKSIVFVDRNQRDLRDGVHLVRLEEMIYVKRLQRLPNHKVKVISDNPIYEPFEVDLKNGDDFEILGKVLRVWIERTF